MDCDLEYHVKENYPVSLDDALKAAINAETHLKVYEQAAERACKEKNRQETENSRMREVKERGGAFGKKKESENTQLMKQILEQMVACQRQTEERSRGWKNDYWRDNNHTYTGNGSESHTAI